MKLTIDNLDGRGPLDYTASIDSLRAPKVVRRLNRPSELQFSLVANTPDFMVPVNGARVTLGRMNGKNVFTGYLTKKPEFHYLGWGERGPIYRYNIVARSDEFLLERKTTPGRPPFVDRGAGDALRQLTEEILPNIFDTSAVQDLDTVPWYRCDRQKNWSTHAAEIALQARAHYRVMDGALTFGPVGEAIHVLDESANDFAPQGLKLVPTDHLVNEITVVGRLEPSAYVKDYFVGDGLSLRFYLSQMPFTKRSRTVVDEEYLWLDPTRWTVLDPAVAVSVSGGKLLVEGGTGVDGQTLVQFIEKIELGGVVILQHGNIIFNGASDGIVGGLYANAISAAGCLAGFQITPFGTQSRIQAIVNGTPMGASLNTQTGHQYALTSRLYSPEIYRTQQTFHSSLRPAGLGRGGASVAADVRAVLEVHDIDPGNPGSLAAPSTVLYDGVLTNGPQYCTYALLNSTNLHCSIAFTRILQAADAEIRSALPGLSYRTRLVGSLAEGAECRVSTDPSVQFFPQYVPAPNEQIVVRYRGLSRALARVSNSASIVMKRQGSDDGVRGAVRNVKAPAPRTSVDCENAALGLLDDAIDPGWAGEYEAWSDYLPGKADDIFPGETIEANLPSRGVIFRAIIREVEIEVADLQGEHSRYKIHFADDASEALAFELDAGRVSDALNITATEISAIGTNFLSDLTGAEITQVTSTTVSIDSGINPLAGGGVEVRRTDSGWGQENDRNLLGRFSTRTFSVPRLARVQDYFLRQYDSSSPAKYSRYSAALHVDYPL